MKSYTSILTLFAIVAPALAQLAGLPQCAVNCAIGALPSQCSLTDISCICQQQSYIQGLEPCVQSSCSPADQTAALSGASALCASAGVTLSVSLPQSSQGSTIITTTPASSQSSGSSVSVSPSSTFITPTPVPPVSGSSATSISASITSTPLTLVTGNVTQSSSASASQFTGAAAPASLDGLTGALIAGFGAVFALF